jgi:5-formyltetrahydrofolate cyclo-ligase
VSKETIRKTIIAKRIAQAFLQKNKNDKEITRRLKNMPLFKRARVFFTYLSNAEEVSTDALIEQFLGAKKILVPVVRNGIMKICELKSFDEFRSGKFGIREPKNCVFVGDLKAIDLVIVPGIAFDKTGHRVGFGGGYFDRFLKKIHCTTIGLAYEFQIVDKIPAKKYDMPVDYIVTERRVIKCVRPVPKK